MPQEDYARTACWELHAGLDEGGEMFTVCHLPLAKWYLQFKRDFPAHAPVGLHSDVDESHMWKMFLSFD